MRAAVIVKDERQDGFEPSMYAGCNRAPSSTRALTHGTGRARRERNAAAGFSLPLYPLSYRRPLVAEEVAGRTRTGDLQIPMK